MSFAAMRSSVINIDISDRTPDPPAPGGVTHNTRSNPLSEWIGMAWRMRIGTTMGLLFGFIDLAARHKTKFQQRNSHANLLDKIPLL